MPQKPKWTAATRAAFIARLAECGEVRAALATVGLSAASAYRLRATDPDFARAWDTALLQSRQVVVAELTSRALHGWQEEVWFRGELVGTRTRHDSRLLLALLARLDVAAGREDEARVRRAAPHFADVLAALRHDVPLGPWFDASLAEKQEAAIDTACRRQRFWHYAALMDDAMIADVMGPGPDWDDEEEPEEEEVDEDGEDAAADTAADWDRDRLREHPAERMSHKGPDDASPCPDHSGDHDGVCPAPIAPDGMADSRLPAHRLSPPRGCHPVSTMADESGELQGSGSCSTGPCDQPPLPPEPEQPGGPLSAVEREAMEGEMAELSLARFGPAAAFAPLPAPP